MRYNTGKKPSYSSRGLTVKSLYNTMFGGHRTEELCVIKGQFYKLLTNDRVI